MFSVVMPLVAAIGMEQASQARASSLLIGPTTGSLVRFPTLRLIPQHQDRVAGMDGRSYEELEEVLISKWSLSRMVGLSLAIQPTYPEIHGEKLHVEF